VDPSYGAPRLGPTLSLHKAAQSDGLPAPAGLRDSRGRQDHRRRRFCGTAILLTYEAEADAKTTEDVVPDPLRRNPRPLGPQSLQAHADRARPDTLSTDSLAARPPYRADGPAAGRGPVRRALPQRVQRAGLGVLGGPRLRARRRRPATSTGTSPARRGHPYNQTIRRGAELTVLFSWTPAPPNCSAAGLRTKGGAWRPNWAPCLADGGPGQNGDKAGLMLFHRPRYGYNWAFILDSFIL